MPQGFTFGAQPRVACFPTLRVILDCLSLTKEKVNENPKFIEVQFTDGKVSKISNEFGLGRVNEK